jgi:penicillin amidase
MIGRGIRRILAGAVSVLIIGFLLAFLVLRASLPELDGEHVVAGIDAPVLIERDAAGIPTITAESRADVAFATGYAHGQDRFFQMDLVRRRAAGELAELFGTVAVDVDRRYRFHRFRARARQGLAELSGNERELLERYAQGVNAGLASLAAKPFEYLLLGSEPKAWQPEDSILVVYTMFAVLNDATAIRDIRRGLAKRILPTEVYAWLYPQGTGWDAPLMGTAREPVSWPAEHVYSVRGFADESPAANEVGKPQLNGSNNWAVSGRLTETGRAIVSNDMHLGLSAPNIYYQARLVQAGDAPRAVTGVTLPGAPFIIAGSNSRVAWGYTNSYGDWTDAVVLKPGLAAGSYRTPNGDQRFVEHAETILVKDAAPVEMVVRETIWGPVNETVDYPDGEIAVSWIAHKVDAVNLRIIDLEGADSVEAALNIANTMGLPPQNFVAGDADGNIAWTIAGKIPLRGEFDPMLPADWSESPGWLGWLDSDAYPRIVNPPSGRLWTANARVADGEALRIIGDGGYDLGARARQIRDGLFAKDRFEPADMLKIQYDDRALFLAPWRDLLLDVLDDATVGTDPELLEYRRLVRDWIPRAAPESVGYRLVRAFRLEVQARVFYGLMGPVREAYGEEVKLRLSNQFEGPLWGLLTDQPAHLLPGGYDSWHDLMMSAVRQNLGYFATRFGGSLGERTGGERNTARIQHPLSAALPVLSGLLDMPSDPLNGDVDLPKAQGPTFGASERFSVSPGDEANGIMHMPTGQSGHPLSEFYRRGHDDWVHGKPSPFLPGDTLHTLTLTPKR